MKGFIWLFLCSVLFCVSCKRQPPQKEAGLIFYNNYRGPTQLWIDGKEADLVPLRSFPERWKDYIYFNFDWKTNKLWARTVLSTEEAFFFADVTDGTYNAAKEFMIKKPEGERLWIAFVYNDEVIIEYYKEEDTIHYPGLYVITDLKTGRERIVDLRGMFAKTRVSNNFLIGYDGKRLFFDKGWYDMENGQYYPYPPDKHSYIRYHAPVRGTAQVVEVHNHDYFMRIYDTQSGEYRGEGINLRKINIKDWCNVYAEEDRLFITIGTNNAWIIPPGGMAKGKTFKYDMRTKTLTEIEMPHVYARIVGRIRE